MFQFSLQSVLDVRERLEKLRYKEYSTVLLERQRLESEIDRRQGAMERAAQGADEQRRLGRSALPLQLHDQYRKRLQNEVVRLRQQVKDQEQQLEAKRKQLVEARRAHRALEILRDKEHDRYESELARRERITMDEVASNYHQYRK
ncbi:MAG: flagellar export protein FliJ [Candidatus Lambdaproteobacteria bacterium]|nr:flagellar export protein FliJ [Candidatus Lambdaproteobacteria bacterium]